MGEGLLEGVQLPATPQSFAEFGGLEPHDNSGIIRYVSVRHAGDPLTEPGDELNGVSLAGIGDGTIFEFVEVYTNWDDGFEWFGGTVNGNHLITIYAGDDMFDIDQGYTGALQYLVALMPFFKEDTGLGGDYGSGSGDRMGEWDGTDGTANVVVREDFLDNQTEDAPWPFPYAYVFNMTGVGSVPDGTNPAGVPRGAAKGIFVRNGFGGNLANSIIVNTGTQSCFEVDVDVAGDSTPGYLVQDNNSNDLVRYTSSVCADGAAPNATSAANGDAYAQSLLGNNDGDNVTSTNQVLVQEDPGFNPLQPDGKLEWGVAGSNPGGVTPYDLRPTGDGVQVGITPQDTGLDRAGNYRGAFENGATELWTTPWSAGNIGGILAD
jgi:hypothetical protein